MRRRDLIGLTAGAIIWPARAGTQEKPPAIGFLSSRSPGESARVVAAFQDGLRERRPAAGSIPVAYRWAEGRLDRLSGLAAELASEGLAVLVAAGGSDAALAARGVSTTLPIVFVIGGDPVRLGLVASLARPGGNATGVTIISGALAPKRLALLRDVVPAAKRFAVLVNPGTPEGRQQAADAGAAAAQLGLDLAVLQAGDERSIEAALARAEAADALLVGSDPVFDVHRDKIVALIAKAGVPAIYQFRDFAISGGLMSYDPGIAEAYRQAGRYVGEILSGARAADLPVRQPTKFELVINLRTAQALRLTIPPTLLARADEVIE